MYDIFRGIVFILLVVILYQFSSSGPDTIELEEDAVQSSKRKIDQNIPIHKGVHEQYEQLLNMVFNIITAINSDYRTAFFMLDVTGKQLKIQSSSEDGFLDLIQIDNEIIQATLSQDEAVLFQQTDVKEHWNEILNERSWRGSECIIGSRISYKNAPVGCLLVMTHHFSAIKERDKDLLTGISRFVSLSLIKLENIEKLSMDKYFHYQIANLLNSMDIQSEVRGLYEKVRDLCRSLFSYDKFTINRLNSDKTHYKVVLEDGYSGDVNIESVYSINGNIHGIPFRSKETISSSNISDEFYENGRFEPGDLEDHPFSSILSVPVIIDDEVRYSLSIEKQKFHHFSNSDKNLLELLALTFGSIVSWQQQYWKMHENAMTDGLTGLLNHKAFMNRYQEEISRANRYQHSLVMAILDLDKFKRINDTYGHLYGDYVIREVAKIIKENVRTIDIVGRYGGEEYAILMINTTNEKIVSVAERIIDNVESYPFSMENIDVNMTISCGLAEFPKDTDNMKELIANADEAMYDAKKEGGNFVKVYGIENGSINEHPENAS